MRRAFILHRGALVAEDASYKGAWGSPCVSEGSVHLPVSGPSSLQP